MEMKGEGRGYAHILILMPLPHVLVRLISISSIKLDYRDRLYMHRGACSKEACPLVLHTIKLDTLKYAQRSLLQRGMSTCPPYN